jgi:type III secretory pathway component EscT
MSFPSRRAKAGIVVGILLWVFVDLAYFLAGGFWFVLGYLIGIYLLLFGLAWHISTGLRKYRAARSSD